MRTNKTLIEEAIELLEKANADLQPELLDSGGARELLSSYARAGKLIDYGVTALSRKVHDCNEVAKATGTSVGVAKAVVETGEVLGQSDDLSLAMQQGEVSLEQAQEIARAEASAPGAAKELVTAAQEDSFQVFREKARKVKLEAEQQNDLHQRQRAARSARPYTDPLGMVHVHLALEPHVGTAIVNRAEADAQRLYREAKKDGRQERFECHLADAFAQMLAGGGKARTKRAELVVLVSHEVVKRGWRDVRRGETCKIPGVGPVSPAVAKQIAQDAFLNGVFYDGVDLRHFKRWTRDPSIEVRVALELGPPPDFDGVKCIDCGKRFRIENDHVEPHAAGGPAATGNFKWRCWDCHKEKTRRDRAAGKLKAAKQTAMAKSRPARKSRAASRTRDAQIKPPDP